MDSEETLPALQDKRSVMSFFNLDAALDGRPMEGVPVLEPLEHSVLEMALDGRPMERRPVLRECLSFQLSEANFRRFVLGMTPWIWSV